MASQHRSKSVRVMSFSEACSMSKAIITLFLAAVSKIGRNDSMSIRSRRSVSIVSVRAQSELSLIETLVRGTGPR